ncbi:hypothetical protein FGRMN_5764 [Fusarium graminum]|nr:hypothetical protein FGRMN_5764 [Fusarium graminum]
MDQIRSCNRTLHWKDDQQGPKTGMPVGPSAVRFRDTIYSFHQSSGKKGDLWFNVYEDSHWRGDAKVSNVGISAGPSAVVFNGKIYVFHQGSGGNGEV